MLTLEENISLIDHAYIYIIIIYNKRTIFFISKIYLFMKNIFYIFFFYVYEAISQLDFVERCIPIIFFSTIT